MRIYVIAPALVDHVSYAPGQVLDVADPVGRMLLAAAPGSFAIDAPAPVVLVGDQLVAAPAAPPADKMIRGRRTPQP